MRFCRVLIIAITCASTFALADPTLDQAYQHLKQRQEARDGATTKPATKQELNQSIADLQKQIDDMRLEIRRLQATIAQLQAAAGPNPDIRVPPGPAPLAPC